MCLLLHWQHNICIHCFWKPNNIFILNCLIFCCGGSQIDVLEDARKQVVEGALEVQKCFPGHHACQDFHKLKEEVVTLQSCTTPTVLDENVFFFKLSSDLYFW